MKNPYDVLNDDMFIYSELSQKAIKNVYQGGKTNTAEVLVDNATNTITVNAKIDVDKIEEELEQVHQDYQRMEGKLEQVKRDVEEQIQPKLDDLDEKIDTVNARVDKKADSSIIAGIESKMTVLDGKVAAKASAMYYDSAGELDPAGEGKAYWYMSADINDIPNSLIKNAEGKYIPYNFGAGGGGGGGGGTVTTKVTIDAVNWPSTIAEGNTCKIKVNWSSKREDTPTGNGTISVFVNETLAFSKKNTPQGLVELDITKYLSSGTNTVEVRATDAYSNMNKVIAEITTVTIKLESGFNYNRVFKNVINYTYVPTGNVLKTVYFYVDGALHGSVQVSESGEQKTYNIEDLTHGSHTLRVYFECVIDGNTVRSNELNYDLMYEVEGNTTPIIVSTFNSLQQEQYVSFKIPYRVYTPNHNLSDIALKKDGVTVQTLSVDQTEQIWEYMSNDVGTFVFSIECGAVKREFSINVKEAEINVQAVTENLALYLTSFGRQNSEAHPEKWEDADRGISCTLSNFNFVSDGWIKDTEGNTALKVSGDARVTIPYKIFERDFRSIGKTIEIEMATEDVRNYESPILSCWSGDRGIYVTPQLAKLSSQQTTLKTQYKEDDHVRLTFVVEKNTETHLILMYINGVMSGAVQYPLDDNFRQLDPVNISIGSNNATVNIYNIRIYDNNLTRKQVVNNWIADTASGLLRKTRFVHNNNYNESGQLVISKLPSDLPYIVYEAEVLPTYKGDKRTANVRYVDPVTTSQSYTSSGATMNVQGTSSQYYYRKNFKIKYGKGFVQDGLTNSKYPIRPDAIKEKEFTYKADVASSEGANNVELVRYYEDSKNWLTPPERIDNRVRVGIDGFPIVAFHNNGTETTFYGKMNFNNDKGNSDTYGFIEGDESWEITNNNTPQVLFQSDDLTHWEDSFESRYPETAGSDEHAYGTLPAEREKLQAMVSWVVSTRRLDTDTEEQKAAKLEKFRTELTNFFDKQNTLFYYLYTELFLLVDSRAKNCFPTYYVSRQVGDGGNKWYWIPYDMDTAIGINNEGVLEFDYNLEDTDLKEGAKIYTGQDSVMWNNVRDAFKDELKVLYQNLRSGNVEHATVPWKYEVIEGRFEEHQNKWSENIFNEDSYVKCLVPLINDNDKTYLPMLQGSKAEQRRWWLYNRFRYLDSKYDTGEASAQTIMMRAYQKSDFHITTYNDIYIRANFDDQIVTQRANKNTEYLVKSPASWDPKGTDAVVGLFSADQIKDVGDLSAFKPGYADFSKATRLQKLIIGSSAVGFTNEKFAELIIGNNKMLQVLDVRNCINLKQPVDVSGCTNIEEIYFDNTAVTGIQLPVGGILKKLHLPGTLTNLTIRNQKSLQELQIAGTENVQTLWLENIPSSTIDALTFISQMQPGSAVRVIGFDQHAETISQIDTMYDLLDTMHGINAQGEEVEKAQVSGKISIDVINWSEQQRLLARYPDIQIVATRVQCKVTFYNDGVPYEEHPQIVDQGTSAVRPAVDPIRPSTQQYYYTFTGWDKEFTNVQTDLDINATYEQHIQVYTVTFDTQTTKVTVPPQQVEYGSCAKVPQPQPYIEGSTFDGWFMEPNTINQYDFNLPVLDSFTLYAKWTDVDAPNVSVERKDYKTFKYVATDNIAIVGYAITNSQETPTEWISITPTERFEGEQVVTTSGKYYVHVKDAASHTAKNFVEVYVIAKDTAVGTTIDVYEDTATVGILAIQGTVIVPVVTLDSHYENLTFTCNGEAWTSELPVVVAENLILKTTCTPKSYEVDFNMMGKGEQVESQTIVYNNCVVEPTPQFVAPYLLDSWYTDITLQNKWDFNTGVSEDMTLFAKWIQYHEPTIVTINVPDNENTEVKCNFYTNTTGGITVNWGDGTSESNTTTGSVSLTHDYVVSGEYQVRITCNSGTHYLGGGDIGKPVIYPASYITNIVFAFNVEYMNNYGLDGAINLTSVQLTDYMTKVGVGQFRGCTSLTSVTIPRRITVLDDQAFMNCTSLTGTFNIEDTVTEIGDSCFLGCSGITKFNISDTNSIEILGASAFNGCTGLTEALLPEKITVINNSLYRGCTGITSIEVPQRVTAIYASAFADCSNLESVKLLCPDITTFEAYVFLNCQKLVSIGPLGSNSSIEFVWTKSIPAHAFEFSSGSVSGSYITSVTLPATIETIGNSSFACCDKLVTMELPQSLNNIEDNAFYNCKSLTTAILPNSLETIGDNTFGNCYAISNVILPSRLTSIGRFAFMNCFAITTISIPFKVESIDRNAFMGCFQLREAKVFSTGSSIKVEDASQSWFRSCASSMELHIPASVTSPIDAYGPYYNYYDNNNWYEVIPDLE